MTDQDSSYYRPRSPDFSSLQTSFPTPSFNYANSPFTNQPTTPTYPPPPPLAHRASYDASPFFSPQYQRPGIPPSHPSQQYVPPLFTPVDYDSDADMSRRSARISSRAAAADAVPFAPGPLSAPLPNYNPQPAMAAPPVPPQVANSAPVPAPRPAPAPAPAPASAPTVPATVPSNSGGPSKSPAAGIEVKTKFPVARIKRIMQADEDVGKVAQVTPIAVSKALELFMISLVTKATKEAKDRNSKRVTASHLKQAIAKDEVLDFLDEIINKVPDNPAGGKKNEDEGSDHNEGGKKKRGGRRPKEDSD